MCACASAATRALAARILIVEDEAITSLALEQNLERMGYEVVGMAVTGREAIDKAVADRPDVVLMDIVLKGDMDGIEVARRIHEQADVAIIYLSAYADDETLARARQTGPFAYLVKPYQDRELQITIDMALYKHKMERALAERYAQLKRTMQGTVEAIAKMLRLQDPFMGDHLQRTAELATSIARRMRLEEAQIEGVRMAAAIHDIGFIALPQHLHTQSDPLDDDDLAAYQTHPRLGYTILKDIAFPWPVADIVLQHHEKLDGSGYPRGLRGNDILIEAQIVGIADDLDAMLSGRPDRSSVSTGEALAAIEAGKGRIYQPQVADACLAVARQRQEAV